MLEALCRRARNCLHQGIERSVSRNRTRESKWAGRQRSVQSAPSTMFSESRRFFRASPKPVASDLFLSSASKSPQLHEPKKRQQGIRDCNHENTHAKAHKNIHTCKNAGTQVCTRACRHKQACPQARTQHDAHTPQAGTYSHRRAHAHAHMYKQACDMHRQHTKARTPPNMHACARADTFAPARTHPHTRARTHARTHTRTHSRTHTRMRTRRTHIHIHTHIRRPARTHTAAHAIAYVRRNAHTSKFCQTCRHIHPPLNTHATHGLAASQHKQQTAHPQNNRQCPKAIGSHNKQTTTESKIISQPPCANAANKPPQHSKASNHDGAQTTIACQANNQIMPAKKLRQLRRLNRK